MKKVLAIDPSMKALGWALSVNGKLVDKGLIKRKSISKKLRPSKKVRRSIKYWVAMIDQMINLVSDVIDQVGLPGVVVIELPRTYTRGSIASQAAKNSGAIEKLVFFVASLRSWFMMRDVDVVLVYPAGWKGQVPKRITQRRMMRKYGAWVADADHNVVDAVGILDWYLGTRETAW